MKYTSVDTTIKYYRKKLKIKQSDLAGILGLTNTNMSFIENKKLYPDTVTAEIMARTLEVPIGKLYEEYEWELILKKTGKWYLNLKK